MAKIKTKRVSNIIQTQVKLGFNEEISVRDLVFPCERDTYGLLEPIKILRKSVKYEDIYGMPLCEYLVSGLTSSEILKIVEQALLTFLNLERKKKSVREICTDMEYVFYDSEQGTIKFIFGTFITNARYIGDPIAVLRKIVESYRTEENCNLDLRRKLLDYLEAENTNLDDFEQFLMRKQPDLLRAVKKEYTIKVYGATGDEQSIREDVVCLRHSKDWSGALEGREDASQTNKYLTQDTVNGDMINGTNFPDNPAPEYHAKLLTDNEYADLHDGMTVMEDGTVRMDGIDFEEDSDKRIRATVDRQDANPIQITERNDGVDGQEIRDSNVTATVVSEESDITERCFSEDSDVTVGQDEADLFTTEIQPKAETDEMPGQNINDSDEAERRGYSDKTVEQKPDEMLTGRRSQKYSGEAVEDSGTIFLNIEGEATGENRVDAGRKKECPFIEKVETGDMVEVNKPCFLIGRDINSVDYAIPNRYVGRNHMGIASRNGRSYLIDMNSKNGTYLNGKRISPNTDVALHDGDIFSIGGENFRFHEPDWRQI